MPATWQDIRPEPFSEWAGERLNYLVERFG